MLHMHLLDPSGDSSHFGLGLACPRIDASLRRCTRAKLTILTRTLMFFKQTNDGDVMCRRALMGDVTRRRTLTLCA